MNKIKILAAAILTFALCGCNDKDDEQLFAGIDNHITSFTLTAKDGAVYRAAIVGDEIVVSVPCNVSLDGAAASYELCEQAILYPNPAKITDWDNEHRFRVMAHNQTLRDYTYSVTRSDVTTGSITLLTQADVEAFAATGATIIEGNLTIGDFSAGDDNPVTDLTPLSDLTDVRYNIIVSNSFAGAKLDGLKGLRTVGGLVLGTAATPLETARDFEVQFPALRSLGQLTVCSAKITNIDLPALESAGTIHVDASMLSVFNTPVLKECTGDLKITVGSDDADNNVRNSIMSALGFPSLEKVTGSMSIMKLAELQLLELPKITFIGGNCKFSVLRKVKTLKISELAHLGGSFTCDGLDAMTTFALPKLTSAASFILKGNTTSAMLAGIDLSLLEEVRGKLMIYIKFLSDRLELPALKSVQEEISMQSLSMVEKISLPSLTTCGRLYFYRLSLLSSLDMPLLTTCGQVEFSYIDLLPLLDLSKVEQIPSVKLTSCYKLAKLKVGKNALKDITLDGGSKLCDFPVFEGAETVSGKLELLKYTQNELISFPGIKSIGAYRQLTGKSNGATTVSFPDLETIGTLTVRGCDWLRKLSAPKLREVTDIWDTDYMEKNDKDDLELPSLRKIGIFKFYGGTNAGQAGKMALTNMDSFKEVTEIGSVDIRYWGKMTDFSGLAKALPSLAADTWNVSGCDYNPTWEQMTAGQYVKP